MGDNERGPGWMPAWLYRLRGARRRKRGLYDRATEDLVRRAMERHRSPENLLAYARFRRDLGFLPDSDQADALLEQLGSLSERRLRHALNLLIECGRGEEASRSVGAAALARFAARSPAIAHALGPGERPSPRARVLAELHGAQGLWRDEFAEHVRSHRGSLCVVGNAATLIGAGIGARIDAHQVVTRFNRYRSGASLAADIGARIDVWVRAPDLGDFDPRGNPPTWVVLSGADPRFHLGSWDAIVALREVGAKVLTVPLPTWRSLVSQLEAPPSAGVLFLAWLIELLESPEGIAVAGFQKPEGDSKGQRYHQALRRHRPSGRHCWEAERGLLREWCDQGLVFL